MRFFKKISGVVMSVDDNQITRAELANAISDGIGALESTVEYSEFEDANAALDALDINTIDVEAAQLALANSSFAMDLQQAQSIYDLDQSSANEEALSVAKTAYESCDKYTALEAAKKAHEQYQIAVQRVESAQEAYESCDEYIELERLKSIKIWIPDDAIEMTEDEIERHINPTISDEQLAAIARAQRDTLIDRVSREIERLTDSGEDVAAWRVYRQFLRDIPDQSGFPQDIDWGVQPADFTGK